MVELMKKTYENHSPNLRLIVRYENLRKNTIEELKKIYSFMEIEISDEELKKLVDKFAFENIPSEKKGKGKQVRSASPGSWRVNLSHKEQEILEKIMGDTLGKFGYE